MTTWLVIKKAWTWLKHNWYAPLVVLYTLVLWILFRKGDKAREILQIRSDSYKIQIDTINKSHQEEIKKRDEIIAKYLQVTEELEEKYREEHKTLDSGKKKRAKEIVEKYHNKPDELARKISEEFGFEYVEK